MKNKSWLAALLLVVLMILAACSSDEEGSGTAGDAGSDAITIAVVPKLIGIPYFNASEEGVKEAGKELGVNVIYTGPTEGDAAEQVKIIEDLISQGVDAIAVAPNDAESLTPVLKKAKEAGIVVLDWDTPADQTVVAASVHQINDEEYGRHLAKELVNAMGTDTGEVAILTGGLSAANLNTWIDAINLEFTENFPNIKLVSDKIATDEKQQVAYQKTNDLIKSYPELKGIVAVSTPAPLGAAQAVQEKGLQDKVAVVGSALPTDSAPYLEDSSLDKAILWEPNKLGFLTVAIAKILVEGGTLSDGMDVEGFGTITVEEDGKTIIMGPPTDFTKDNAGDYDF